MERPLNFDYYYGIEAEQFSFYRVPRLLIKDERFKGLSSDAKLLYGLMLDRMTLSMKNGWIDAQNRAYIIYSLENIQEDLGCSKPTCIKIVKELDCGNGIGLIEKKRRGLGKPDIIYVKNFASADGENSGSIYGITDFQGTKNICAGEVESFTSGSKETELAEEKESDSRKKKGLTSGSKEAELQEVKIIAPNYTYNNENNMSYINPINQSEGPKEDGIDEKDDMNAYINQIKENIEYDHHMKYDDWQEKSLYDELFEVICEVVCVKRPTVRIAGEEYPYELVKAKFLKLDSGHLEYVIGCMKNTTKKIGSIKAYMVTALYNAPSTMNHYYQQEVRHDMYGGGWKENGAMT